MKKINKDSIYFKSDNDLTWTSLEDWQENISACIDDREIVSSTGGKSKTITMDVPQNLDMYEYYYRRGTTYYFRNILGEKIVFTVDEKIDELKRGQEYKLTYETSNN